MAHGTRADRRLIWSNRQFTAAAPNRLWVAAITFVRTWQGFCYTAFIADACSEKLVGWSVSATMRTEELPLQASNRAVWQANSTLSELVHPSDRGSQYLSLAYTDRLAELGIAPSVGSRGDTHDNALAEVVNAAYRTVMKTIGTLFASPSSLSPSSAAGFTHARSGIGAAFNDGARPPRHHGF